MTIIDTLRNLGPEDRPEYITSLYEKNREYFRTEMASVDQFIENTTCPYHFNITTDFLEIVHSPTNTLAHPESGLDTYAEALGQDNHGAWINSVNFQRTLIRDSPKHQEITEYFEDEMNAKFPDIAQQIASGKVQIRTSGSAYRVMPPLVFAGVFHGLHIDYLLGSTASHRILLVEPLPERFEVSCYFLDYESLFKRFNMRLNIGPVVPGETIKWFHSADKVTSRLWIRVLPCYDAPQVEQLVQQITIQQRILEGQTTSYDREVTALGNGMRNIDARLPTLSGKPNLSENAHIAIVASGPSLKNDYTWLKENQDNLIIIAVHSAVRPLLDNGINVDFQISLDTYLTNDLLDKLHLDNNIPLLTYYKASKDTVDRVDKCLLLIEKNVANSADFIFALEDTFPSSTTLAMSFALYCKPATISLVGVDVGFRDPSSQFITGGFHEKVSQSGIAGDIFQDIPNFKDNGPVSTKVFFNQVKRCIEMQLSKSKSNTQVRNLSDGAYISGTVPMKSRGCVLKNYPDKEHDIELLHAAFATPAEELNYRRYPVSGNDLLNIFRSELSSNLELDMFDWLQLSENVDSCLLRAIEKCKNVSYCLRMTVYERLVADLLTQWYRFILLSPDPGLAKEVYTVGYRHFRESLARLEWPEEGDS